MENLYLVRRKRTEIHGPLRKNELKTFLSKQTPLSEWEVSGNLGPWVFLENEERLKQSYSELWQELNAPSFSWKGLFHRKR